MDAYGTLRDLHVEQLEGHDVIVVLGPNESGKSTLRDFIATGLFGFSPATREAHPYAPDEGMFGGALFLTDADGTPIAVERHLRSAARGRIWRPDRHDDIGNRPLPAAATIGRSLYMALHQVTPDDLTVVSDVAWQAVEDRMLSGSAIAYLRSVAVVRRELEDRAQTLWRPDRRGHPQARAIEARLDAVKRIAREAGAERQRIGEIDDELRELAAAEAERRQAVEQAAGRRRRHERLAPAVAARRDADDMRRRAGLLLPVDDLPADPEAELTRLARSGAEADEERRRAEAALAAGAPAVDAGSGAGGARGEGADAARGHRPGRAHAAASGRSDRCRTRVRRAARRGRPAGFGGARAPPGHR